MHGTQWRALAEGEFLIALSRYPLDDGLRQKWAGLLGPVEPVIGRFVSEGLLEDAPLAEKLARTHSVADLKALLRERGLKVSGAKNSLVYRLLQALPPDKARGLGTASEVYRATALGAERIEGHRKRREQDRQRTEQTAIDHLQRGQLEAARRVVEDYDARQLYPRLTREPAQGSPVGISFSLSDDRVPRRLLAGQYTDLELPQDKRKLVAAYLALADLLGEGFGWMAERLVSLVGGVLQCPSLLSWLRDESRGTSTIYSSDALKDVAELYAHTKFMEASASVSLEDLLNSRVGKGIEILPPDSECVLCNRRPLRFSWSQVGQLPRLPRHWGCRCVYVAWF